jgi:hypothetical protein
MFHVDDAPAASAQETHAPQGDRSTDRVAHGSIHRGDEIPTSTSPPQAASHEFEPTMCRRPNAFHTPGHRGPSVVAAAPDDPFERARNEIFAALFGGPDADAI